MVRVLGGKYDRVRQPFISHENRNIEHLKQAGLKIPFGC